MNPYRKGLFSGLLSGILWGADTTINGWVLLAVPFSLVDKRLVAASLLLAFFHDLFSALWLTTRQVIKCELKTTVSKLRNKSALFVMLAALFGGPITYMPLIRLEQDILPAFPHYIQSLQLF